MVDSYPLLQTRRLHLRPCAAVDIDALHALWTDPGVRRFLWDDMLIPRETAVEVVESSIASFAANRFGFWAVCLNEEASAGLAGFAGLRFIEGTADVEVLFGFYPRHWDQGLAREAAIAVMLHGLHAAGLSNIFAGADAPNAASIRVIEKLGMKELPESIAEKPRVRRFAVGRDDFISRNSSAAASA